MTLYVIPVPNPAAGHDWTYTIPGQYVEDITAISATLTTTTSVLTVPDESGNGRTATVYLPDDYTIGNRGPFAGGADNYSTFHGNAFISDNVPYATSADDAAFDGTHWSAEQWYYANPPSPPIPSGILGYFNILNTLIDFALDVRGNSADPYEVVVDVSGSTAYTVPGFASRGAWHHVAVTYDGTNVALYADGVLVDSRAQAVTLHAATAAQLGGSHAAGSSHGYCAGPAFFNTTLTAGQVAAHAAASGSWAAYKTAVLANSPSGLWNIGKPGDGHARTVDLEITDGTHVVQEIPPGTVSGVSATGFEYSWQTNLNSSTVSPDGTLVTVAIPQLILPAGYTVGTKTLDLVGTDQWTGINIWWNSQVQDLTFGIDDYHYPPGAYYVYQQIGT